MHTKIPGVRISVSHLFPLTEAWTDMYVFTMRGINSQLPSAEWCNLQDRMHQPNLLLCDSPTCWLSSSPFPTPDLRKRRTSRLELISFLQPSGAISRLMYVTGSKWVCRETHLLESLFTEALYEGSWYWYFIMSLIKGSQHWVFINRVGLVQINMSAHFIMT